jgi:hypothetical protein
MPTININVSGAQSVLERAKLENVTIQGDVAGVIVKDFMINVPRSDMNLTQRERMIYLTDAFIENLAAAVQNQMLVVFFDDIQELTEETYKWLWDELVAALKSGRLQNIRFILCGRTKPQIDADASRIVKEAALKPLELPDIENYLSCNGLIETDQGDRRQRGIAAGANGPGAGA